MYFKSILNENKEKMEEACQLGYQLEQIADQICTQNSDFLPKSAIVHSMQTLTFLDSVVLHK